MRGGYREKERIRENYDEKNSKNITLVHSRLPRAKGVEIGIDIGK